MAAGGEGSSPSRPGLRGSGLTGAVLCKADLCSLVLEGEFAA